MSFRAATERVRPPDVNAARRAAELQDRLTKPRGALGRLELLGERLAAISGSVPPPVPSPAVVAVFAGDHGVVAEGVTPWPKEVTVQMVANFLAGGAAISGWTVTWTFASGQTVTQMWSATPTTSGSSVTARNVSYNGSLPTNGSVTFGFQATFSGTNQRPAEIRLNDTACVLR